MTEAETIIAAMQSGLLTVQQRSQDLTSQRPGLSLRASDIEPKPFRPIVTGWVDQVHDAIGGAE